MKLTDEQITSIAFDLREKIGDALEKNEKMAGAVARNWGSDGAYDDLCTGTEQISAELRPSSRSSRERLRSSLEGRRR